MDILLGDTLFKFEVNRLAFLISFMSSSQRNETHSFLDFAQLQKKKIIVITVIPLSLFSSFDFVYPPNSRFVK